MVASLIIMRPMPIAASGSSGGTNAALALTPDPKEAWSIPANTTGTLDLDLGSAKAIDTFFVGYHTAVAAAPTWRVEARSSLGGAITATPVPTSSLLIADSDLELPRHAFSRYASPSISTPVTSRYWRFTIANPSGQPTLLVPVISLGLAFQPFYGREYGSGRPIGDTGSNDRTFGGGFSGEDGVTFSGFTFTMGDLLDDEVERLYRELRKLGSSRSLLICEDPEPTANLNDRLHWGKLNKIDAYERASYQATRYSLRMDDWS